LYKNYLNQTENEIVRIHESAKPTEEEIALNNKIDKDPSDL
jgi:hypothetical protein